MTARVTIVNRLVAGLRPNPLGELSAPPDPLARFNGEGALQERDGGKKMWSGRRGSKKERRERRKREGTCSITSRGMPLNVSEI